MVFATLKVSASSAVPKTATASKARINPVMRERMVPTAIIPEALKSSLFFIYEPFAHVAPIEPQLL